MLLCFFFFSSRRRHTRLQGDWSSDVCSSDLLGFATGQAQLQGAAQIADLCAVLPSDACRLLGLLALAGLMQLAQYPARFRLQRLRDGSHVDPGRCADHQPLRADGEAYGASARALQPVMQHLSLEDRKSTRLNSSHLVISYAVFCLKKKKQST